MSDEKQPKNVLVAIGEPLKAKYVEEAAKYIEYEISLVEYANSHFVLYRVLHANRDGFKFIENLASEFGKNGETLFWNAGESGKYWFWDNKVGDLKMSSDGKRRTYEVR